jgi:circadian clock protein KaiC
MEREPTGLIDDFISGGFPKGSVILVSGSPGTGKTIFGLRFLYTGARDFDQKCMYISLEQKISDIYEQAKSIGLDFKPLEKNGNVRFLFIDIAQKQVKSGETHIDLIKDEVKRFGAERLVIDSLTPLADFPMSYDELAYYGFLGEIDKLILPSIKEDLIVRMQVHKLIMVLKELKCTTVVTSEIPKNSQWLSRDRVSEFMADGVILLKNENGRSMTMEKIRGTKHNEKEIPFKITEKGIVF